ncbi:hypothetical protein BN1723_016683 [Verticillium longisporum]|uniref:Glucanase n=1 Tax=Verticillium longisporum TaxID=100787 RepID=A0A0G4NJJ2_VERLO|nr:hypothetical protein BN1723_016683 [Verticillium longisporum]
MGLVSAQKPINGEDNHPPIKTWKCSHADGCVEKTNYIVLDSLIHPVYQAANGENCGSWGNAPPKSACPNKEECAENCVMEAIKDYEPYGVKTSGSSLTLHQLFEGRQVSPRVYFLDETKQEYEMLQLTGNEFTFDVDVSRLPCGMNSALYLSEMLADGGKSELNKGGANFGTGYCDAQCFTTPFINGEVTLPTGNLTNGVYDALGNYYPLPEWVVADPDNVAEDDTDAGADEARSSRGRDKEDLTGRDDTEDAHDEAARRREEKGKAVDDAQNRVTVLARISDTSRDISVSVSEADTMRTVARKIHQQSGLPDTKTIRIAYMGKLAKESTPLADLGWTRGHVVNAFVFERHAS